MDMLDMIILLAVTAGIFTLYQKKKKKDQKQETTKSETHDLANYSELRNAQARIPLHGISIVSLYYDSAASYADMEKDGTNTGFDLKCEGKVNDVLKSLKADGYSPAVNALSCVDRVVFYITY